MSGMNRASRKALQPRALLSRAILATVLLTGTAATALAKPLPGFFTGGAAAARADVTIGTLDLVLQRLAAQACPCQGTNGKLQSNGVGPASLPGLITVGATTATAIADREATTAYSTQTATLAGLNLLGGLITADAITAEASFNATETTLDTSTKGTSIVNLVIAGTKIDPKVKPNTKINLPGIGSVTLFAVDRTGSEKKDKKVGIEVDVLLINVSVSNPLGLPIGSVIKVASASAGFDRKQPNVVVGGEAYVADANLSAGIPILNALGQLGVSGIGACTGTGGKTHTATVAGFTTPLFTVGAGTTTAFGGRTGPGTSIAQTTATVASLNLLGGLITTNAITAEVTETAQRKVVTASAEGSSFGGITVLGIPLPLNVPANTNIPLPLLGYVIINEQNLTGGVNGKATVNGLHIVVNTPNLLSLPVGTEIILAHADATAFPLPR